MEVSQSYNATKTYIESLNLGKSIEGERPDGVEWKDPMRMFEEVGKTVPSILRHWLLSSEEDRLAFLEKYKIIRKNEPDEAWQRKLDVRWRDLSFVIQEETRCFTRPELASKGSLAVINAALRILLPAQAPDMKARK